MKTRIILVAVLLVLITVSFFLFKPSASEQEKTEPTNKTEKTVSDKEEQKPEKTESVEKAFSSWADLGFEIMTDASGAYSFSAFAPLNDSVVLLAGSFADGNKVKSYNTRTESITDYFLLPSAPFDIYCENEMVYVLLQRSILAYNSDDASERTIKVPARTRNNQRIISLNNKIGLIANDGNTHILKEGGFDSKKGWLQEDGKYVFVNRFINNKLSEKKVQFSITGNDVSEEEGQLYELPYKLGTVMHLGNSENFILATAEEIKQESPLRVQTHLIAINSQGELSDKISFSEALPNVFYTYLKNPVKIKDNKLYLAVTSPEGFYFFTADIERCIKNGKFEFSKSIKTKEYHYNDHI